MDSVATNIPVHPDTCVSNFCSDKELNAEDIFETVADAPFE